ncbi:MAG: sporulation integral membrane protein YlbJ [Firmicutes bacterium]|jgi:sporulation integral membrane protein YlbJ|nr:sporulation integral membrane protein YlbJ [Bacillota bacterium]
MLLSTIVAVALLILAFAVLRHPLLRTMAKRHAFTLAGAAAAAAITVAMVVYPDAAFEAAVEGLKLWWDIVFPALLPFFIGSQILMGLGVVHFMGVLMEPFMRPLFNLPGVGSFVMAMGLASGYPLGAILTAKLRSDGLCSRTEAERLMSTANTADPLFMTGAVAVGMFHDISLGYVIVAAHYISAVGVGLILGLFGRGRDVSAPLDVGRGNLVTRAFRALLYARRKDGRPIGRLLGDAVTTSVNSLLLIGGFIILFSVVVRILDMVGAVAALSSLLGAVLVPLGWNPAAIQPLTSGFFEITMGAKAAADASAPLPARAMAAGAVIAWSGLSVHAQVAAVTQGTDIRMGAYVLSRVLHAALAAVATAFLMGPAEPVLARLAHATAPAAAGTWLGQWAVRIQYFGSRFALCSGVLLGLSLVLSILRLPRVTLICIGRPRRR